MRFLLYSHDGVGLGHTCRNLSIAAALTELAPRAGVLLATGSDDVSRLGVPSGVDILKLPGIHKLANDRYGSRHLPVSEAELRQLRSRLLESTVQAFRPNVMLVDKHPFGAGGELKDALSEQRAMGGRTVLGLRDILDDPVNVCREWAPYGLPHIIPNHYDTVLVYGQRNVFDPVAEYGFAPRLAMRTRYCGYVLNPGPTRKDSRNGEPVPPFVDRSRPLVLATVGGGEDGYPLLKSFMSAVQSEPWRSVAVSGPLMPAQQLQVLENQACLSGVELHTFLPGLPEWLAAADVVVCMGGYNTLIQALAADSRIVCVPRVEPRREQLVRCAAFGHRGLLQFLRPEQLTPGNLRASIGAALCISREELRERIQRTVHFDGAENAAHALLALGRETQTPGRVGAQTLPV